MTILNLKNHQWAILLALIAGVLIAFPQLYLRYDNQTSYQGVELLGMEDEEPWLSRVREVYDGYPLLNNPYLKEGKSDPYLYQPLGSNIIVSLGRIFSLDINNAILLSRFLFSFLVSLLIYGFVLLFTKEKLVALATSSFLMLGNSLFARRAIFQILQGESPSSTYLNYTRPVNPLMTHLFFFGFLVCFWLFLEKKQWRWGVLSALTLGLSFYDYFYTWTFLYAFLGVLILIFLLRKKWHDAKRIGLVLFGASLIALPYLFNLYRATLHPNYAEVSQRFIVENRGFILGLAVPLLLVVFLLFFSRKKKEQYYFGLALVVAPLIVLNQQFITGKILMTDHYHWYFNLPLAIIFSLLIFFFWISKLNWPIFKKTSAILIIIISILMGLWIQNNSYTKNKDRIIGLQRYGPVMEWLSQNAPKEEVVFANEETSHLVVIYTPLNVFYHGVARMTLAATTARLQNTIFLYYRLDGLTQDKIIEVFFKDRVEISHLVYGMNFRGDREMPDELLLGIIQKGQDSFSLSTSDFFKGMLDQYQVSYLVWDKKQNPRWQLDQYPFLEKVAEIGDFAIYKK